MSVANTAIELIKDLKRGASHRLPPYDEDKVRRCIEEMNKLYEENRNDVTSIRVASESCSSTGSVGTNKDNLVQSVLIRHATMERVKRCLLAYHHARLMQIKEIRWEYGAGIPRGSSIFIKTYFLPKPSQPKVFFLPLVMLILLTFRFAVRFGPYLPHFYL